MDKVLQRVILRPNILSSLCNSCSRRFISQAYHQKPTSVASIQQNSILVNTKPFSRYLTTKETADSSAASSSSSSSPSQVQKSGEEASSVINPNSSSDGIQVSENCAKRLMELTQNKSTTADSSQNQSQQFLRVSVEGGGCSGFQYKFEIDNQTQPDDVIFTHPNYSSALVVVDSTSLEYLKGSVVDFHTELIRSAFRVVQNPKAEHGCSCGASFTVKLD